MNNWINLFLQEVLSKDRLELLPYFQKIKEKWFYLAWWTSLALQLGHRQSIDFDFFIKWDFDENQLFDELIKIFEDKNIKKNFSEKNTLYVEVEGVKISFFWYDYNLLEDLIQTKYFDLASLKDIWCMKLWAIQKRATNKDYVDLYYILQNISLEELIEGFYKKYWRIISEYMILKSLVYFEDLSYEKLIILDNKISFADIKKWLENVVRNYENKI